LTQTHARDEDGLLRALLVVLVTFLAAAAAAAPPGRGAAEKRRQAEEQLLDGDADAALATVEEGLALAPKDRDLLLLRGHALVRLGEFDKATEAYKAYLASGATGRNRRDVQGILDSLAQASSTFLRVVVKNGPGDVRIDSRTGRVACASATECKKAVMPGDHLVVVDREGKDRVTKRVVVEPRTVQTVELALPVRASPLVIRTRPPGATVKVDELEPPDEIAPGQHTVVATLSGFITRTETFRAEAGVPVTLELTLEPVPRARVRVADPPPGSILFVDGNERSADATVEVAPGTHTIEVEVPGAKRRFRRTADVAGGMVATVELPASRPRIKAWVSAGVMVAGLATGTIFGLRALDQMKKYDDRKAMPGTVQTDATQRGFSDTGKRDALITDVAFGASVVAMGLSIYWFRTEGRVRGGVEVRPFAGGAQVSGSF
jgi:hypothetical protein